MRFFIPTNKLVKSGGQPVDRLMFVNTSDQDSKILLGWKCLLTKNGVKHPAIKAAAKTANSIHRFDKTEIEPRHSGHEVGVIDLKKTIWKELTLSEVLAELDTFKSVPSSKASQVFDVTLTGFGSNDGSLRSYDWINIIGRIDCQGTMPDAKRKQFLDAVAQFKNKLDIIANS